MSFSDKMRYLYKSLERITHPSQIQTTCFWFAASDIKVFHLDGSFPALYNDLLMFSTYGLWGVIDSNCLLDFAPSFSFLIHRPGPHEHSVIRTACRLANSSQLWRCRHKVCISRIQFNSFFKTKSSEPFVCQASN